MPDMGDARAEAFGPPQGLLVSVVDVLAEVEAYELVDRLADQLHVGCAVLARQGGDLPYDAVLSRLARRVLAREGVTDIEIVVAQKPATPTGISTTKALRVFEADGYACRTCGQQDDLTVDHILPRSRGGSDAYANLQTLCRSCNSRKGVR